MIPVVASLLSAGLNILGGAVVAKGKEVVEEKLGVNLEKLSTSDEGLFKLKQLELEYEEFLRNAALEETKLEYEDVKSARQMAATLSTSTSWLNQNIMPILALLTVVSGCFILWFASEPDVKMAATSFITMVLGFFFGSSKGSKDKQELLSKVGQ